MAFLVYPVTDTDGDLSFVAIVDPDAREVWTLSSAGGNAVPPTEADGEFIVSRDISEPADLVGVVIRNTMAITGDPASCVDLPSALHAADLLLFEAQGGREPRDDIPVDLRSSIVQLERDGQALESRLLDVAAELRDRIDVVRLCLTKPIQLPDRFVSPASNEDSPHAKSNLLSRLDDIDESLMATIETVAFDSSPENRDALTSGAKEVHPRRVASKDSLEALGLSKRVLGLLDGAGVTTVGQLMKKTERNLKRIPGFDESAQNEVGTVLHQSGLELKAPKDSASVKKPKGADPEETSRIPQGFEVGHISTFLPERGFGFIVRRSVGQDIFFHSTAVSSMSADETLTGKTVIFKAGADRQGRPRATEVREWQ